MEKNGELPWWVLPSLSFLWTLIFAMALIWACLKGDNADQNLMIGALINTVAMVVGYWFGSSHSNAKKDDTIAAAVGGPPAPAPAVPAPPAPPPGP
jgi:hypothetical protein